MTEEKDKLSDTVKDIQSKTSEMSSHVDNLLQRVTDGDIQTSKGISFLEVKYQLLLSYLIDLTQLMLQKSQGKSIEGNPSVWRLVELRTVLEKMKPIDQKLKYQIDKVIKIANTGSTESSDPLRYKANPDNFASKLDSEDEDSEAEEGNEDKEVKIYRPPHIAAVAYDGDEKEKEVRAIEKAKKRALSSSIMRELKEEYSEGPQEIKESRDLHRLSANRKAKERLEYEEDNFMRIAVSKKEKNKNRSLATMSSLNTLTEFNDISALTEEGFTPQAGSSGKKRKFSGKGKKGKKGFKKKKK